VHHKHTDKCDYRVANLEWSNMKPLLLDVKSVCIVRKTPDQVWELYSKPGEFEGIVLCRKNVEEDLIGC
jgi:hypothetical protein